MIIKIEPLKINVCSYCLGTGKVKAMQSVSMFNVGSIRGKDTTVKCKHCNGIGIIN